ncbi:DUF3192 domain-containing protein [Alkalimonas collagenimarina]|uniref:DUF3192 domain-containing protein n=1 Tax=Alkalimonas collagenimarina TaxID=400390 RepID=A0ABT9GV50_9GAMM|nr:DUF3192 domain-containing protein [Alkalimonas collagenimarina]MDP4534911.1 DUF3192 domain-containing protein [Alkalimonas collagenimarina]
MHAKNWLVPALMVFSLSGCVIAINDHNKSDSDGTNWRENQKNNRQYINQLTTGTPMITVMQQLGTADFTETFQKDDDAVQVLFYRTHHRRSDGMTTKDECTPLVFKNGQLTGWGEKAYNYL